MACWKIVMSTDVLNCCCRSTDSQTYSTKALMLISQMPARRPAGRVALGYRPECRLAADRGLQNGVGGSGQPSLGAPRGGQLAVNHLATPADLHLLPPGGKRRTGHT